MENLVGVVIPTYNRLEETMRAVNSVVAQTVKVSQIVVVDDGSEKDIVLALRNFLSKFNIKFIELPHSGNPGKVRNVGVRELSTEFVAFLDSDDIWMPKKIEKQIELIESSRLGAICTNADVFGGNISKRYFSSKRKSRIDFRDLVYENLIISSSVVVRASILKQCNGFAEKIAVQGAEDYATWLRVACFTDWIYLDEPLVRYSKESITHFSDTTYNMPELQAYLDFFFWNDSQSFLSKVKKRVVLGVIRSTLSKGER